MTPGTLYYGDCLEWMDRWDDECVDLIYLDPPFNSKTNYNILYSAESAGDAQMRAFADTWQWDEAAGERMARFEGAVAHPLHDTICGLFRILGPSGMMAYLSYMAERLLPTRRLLKPTGSIYLHCDPTASHYLKVLMDAIYGPKNFRNEIIWYYYNKMHDYRKKLFPAATDTLLFYVRDLQADFYYSQLTEPRDKPVRQLVRRKRNGRMVNARDEDGNLLYQTKTDRTLDNVWRIPCLQPASKERLGYPTQKPLALLERVIRASSREGDVVLDPFCGCGTAVEAAHRMGRQWVGIDISPFAVDLIRNRRLKDMKVPAEGIPNSLASARMLARERPFAFETWAVTRIPGFAPNQKQRNDGGIDGRGKLADKPEDMNSRLALAQVKGGTFSASSFRDFQHVLHRDKAAIGCFLTLEPAPASARADAKRFGTLTVSGYRYDRLHAYSMRDYFAGSTPQLPAMLDPYTGKPMHQMELF